MEKTKTFGGKSEKSGHWAEGTNLSGKIICSQNLLPTVSDPALFWGVFRVNISEKGVFSGKVQVV